MLGKYEVNGQDEKNFPQLTWLLHILCNLLFRRTSTMNHLEVRKKKKLIFYGYDACKASSHLKP